MPLEPRPPLIKRLRPGHWLLLDCAAAALYALIASGTLALVAAVLVAVPIALGRRRPLTAFAILLAAACLVPVSGTPQLAVMALAPMACVLFLVAAGHRARISITVLALSMSVPVATALPGFVHKGGIAPFALVYVTVWAIGYAFGQHRRYGEELLEVEREKAHRGVVEERIRIARELHDVVAHSMSVITVQAGFGHLVIDDRPAEARAALGAIETTGREALAEMRRLLGVLREEDHVALTPAPGLADIDRLIEQTAKAGVHVDLQITGSPRDLPAGIELSAYRIMQEALTNVVKHAGTPDCRVIIDFGPDELSVEVIDDGSGGSATDGHGLVGMRERVSLYGGRFDAAPLPGRGFRVTARLPLAGDKPTIFSNDIPTGVDGVNRTSDVTDDVA